MAKASSRDRDQREQRELWLERIERWVEWPLTVLALVWIVLLLMPYALNLNPHSQQVIECLDYLIWGIFAADLTIRLAISTNRRAYARTHWFDILLVFLPLLRPLRMVRSLRLLRLLLSVRVLTAAARVHIVSRRILFRHGVHYLLLTALIVVIVTGSLVVLFERNAPDATIQSLPDGLWWAIVTISTVGYGDAYPKTAAGRGIAIALILVGIALFGMITANLASFFVEDRENDIVNEVRKLQETVASLKQDIAQLRGEAVSDDVASREKSQPPPQG